MINAAKPHTVMASPQGPRRLLSQCCGRLGEWKPAAIVFRSLRMSAGNRDGWIERRTSECLSAVLGAVELLTEQTLTLTPGNSV